MKRIVLVTGAAGTIGSEICKKFALSGYDIIACCNKSYDKALELKALIETCGAKVTVIKADLSKDEDILALAEAAGYVDVLVNNAGISDTCLFTDETNDSIASVINTDLTSAIKLTRHICPAMITKKNGVIINITSMWGECGASMEVVYSAAKAGLIGFTKALAKELAPCGIRVNCVSPGAVNSQMLNEHSEATLEELRKSTPLSRLGEASDVANAVLFLASQKADYITGEVLRVNGGFLI